MFDTSVVSIVNFVCIMVLFGSVLYTFGKYAQIKHDVEDLLLYREINEKQLQNLVQDLNYNNRYLASVLREHAHE